ncbi:MAG TPA: PQQ-dependent sugar dehydrogenase [Gemmatimonadales bacterium]|nr:PQQ-dependent sugar dehydrogenase [Gemmatimonadales bacterium]
MALRHIRAVTLLVCLLFTWGSSLDAQTAPQQWAGVPPVPVPDVTVIHTADEPNVMLRVVTRGLTNPWGLAFLPNGDMLVTERLGRLRLIRGGVLDTIPVAGVPAVEAGGRFNGLLDVTLHPDFAANRTLYLTFTTAGDSSTIALARARFDGTALHDLRVIFRGGVQPIRVSSSRVVFAPDGTLFLPVAGAFTAQALRAQDPADHAGKVLRLRDDGTPPPDNPFVGREGYRPEIYSMGHRNVMGLALHPATGELWGAEHAPQGGDEVNIIRSGRNYGWPVVSFGREYEGPRVSQTWSREGMELPEVVWLPSIAPSSMMFYTGNHFPAWQGDLFVGSMMEGRIQRTGHIERVKLNDSNEEVGREAILTELRRRVRDVRQGPDGLIYVLLGDQDGILVRLEPITSAAGGDPQ